MSEPPSKRVKVDSDSFTPIASTSNSAPYQVTITPGLNKFETPKEFSFEGEEGLFGLVWPSLGFRASNEDETGILEYVDPTVPPFSGIIKHRLVK